MLIRSLTSLLFVCLCLNPTLGGSLDDLNKRLMTNYSRLFIPYTNAPLVVTIYTQLTHLLHLDAQRETMQLKQYFLMEWLDHRLMWDPVDYDNITMTRFKFDKIWMPDIVSLDVNSQKMLLPDEYNQAIVNHDGLASVYLLELDEIQCTFNVEDFPYDVQTCITTYSPWTHNRNQIRLKAKPMPLSACVNASSAEFEIVGCNVTVLVDVYPTMEPGVTYDFFRRTIVVARKSGFYIWTQLMPTSVVTCLALVGLFTPSSHQCDRTDKVTLGITALLAIAVLLMTVSASMPRNFQQFPALGKFLLTEFTICLLGTFVAAMLMRAHAWCNAAGTRPFSFMMRKKQFDLKDDVRRLDKTHSKTRGKTIEQNRLTTNAELILTQIVHELSTIRGHITEFVIEKEITNQIKHDFERIDVLVLCSFMIINVIVLVLYI